MFKCLIKVVRVEVSVARTLQTNCSVAAADNKSALRCVRIRATWCTKTQINPAFYSCSRSVTSTVSQQPCKIHHTTEIKLQFKGRHSNTINIFSHAWVFMFFPSVATTIHQKKTNKTSTLFDILDCSCSFHLFIWKTLIQHPIENNRRERCGRRFFVNITIKYCYYSTQLGVTLPSTSSLKYSGEWGAWVTNF